MEYRKIDGKNTVDMSIEYNHIHEWKTPSFGKLNKKKNLKLENINEQKNREESWQKKVENPQHIFIGIFEMCKH